jgi:uncharacterized phage protein (TIGR01671 family)
MDPKFRAWDNRFSEFVEDFFVSKDGKIYKISKDTGYGFAISRETSDKVILMQSTGLKDKNGKEIFEGDLIKTSSAVCLVDFGEYTYLEDDETEITAIGFYLAFLNTHPVSCCPFESLFWTGCEVIGNIHENELDLLMYEAWKFNKEMSDDTKI